VSAGCGRPPTGARRGRGATRAQRCSARTRRRRLRPNRRTS
jgi:hypothetical protein